MAFQESFAKSLGVGPGTPSGKAMESLPRILKTVAHARVRRGARAKVTQRWWCGSLVDQVALLRC